MSTIEIKKIGITNLKVDAIVNAANEGLWEGGGVCGAIFSEAGSAELTKACQKYGHCDTGNAVITPGFNLPAKYIIHAVGPRWIDGKHNEPSLLYDAYKNSLLLAKENNCHSIAFPLISSGIFGYSKKGSWEKGIKASRNFIEKYPDYEIQIIFAVLDARVMELGQSVLASLDGNLAQVSDSNNEIVPGKYRHYKGNYYEVIGVAKHSETEESMVVYKALYGDYGLWVRPAKMWNELISIDGKQVKRFELIDTK